MNDYNNDLVKKIPKNKKCTEWIDLNVRSYAGYANANFNEKTCELFYWFFESQKVNLNRAVNQDIVEKTPLIIWLNGGPGAPSTLGLFLENGPFRMNDDGDITINKYSWNEKAHIMYWDQPIGTGYSRIKNENSEKTYVRNEDELSEIFYYALQDFYSKHPEYRNCPLYIAGESYGAKYVPNIALKIHEKNNSNLMNLNKINLKGISVGDGWINAELQMKVYIDYVFNMGYIDITQKEMMFEYYNNFCDALNKKNWKDAYNISNNIVNNVSTLGGNFDLYNITRFTEISMENLQDYMEISKVKEILNVPVEQKWNCNDNSGPVAENLIKDNMQDSSSLYGDIIKHSDLYKVLMYTGTLDTACGSLSTELILYNLKKWEDENKNKEWKKIKRGIWEQHKSNVKGFIKKYINLTQIVIPNSGHQVPYYKPEISREMIYKWIMDEEFPTYYPEIKRDEVKTKQLNLIN
jgi:vitellogenic carboxypeptidase-like protein